MPYYEIMTDTIPCRTFVRGESFSDAIDKLLKNHEELEEENICSIERWHFNEVIF